MFSASHGVAIATFWNKSFTSLRNSYLTTTVNGRSHGGITGVLPTRSWDPSGQGTGLIAFVSPEEGYIEQPAPRRPLFTSNGGRTWKSVAFVGQTTSLTLSHGRVIVSAERCPNGSDPCATRLGVFSLRSLTPTSDTVIPSLSERSTNVPPQVLAMSGPTGWLQRLNTHRDVRLGRILASSDQSVSWVLTRRGATGKWFSLVHAVRTGCGNDEGV